MKALLAPFYFIYKLWIGFVFWFSLILLYLPFVWVYAHPSRHNKAFGLKRFWGKLIRVLILCPIEIEYEEELPKEACIIVSNHGSYLDTVFMYEAVKSNFLFVGKGELLNWPLFSLFFRKQDIPIRRGQTKAAVEAMNKVGKSLNNGLSVALYPEGTIPDNAPALLPFKNGAFKVAVEHQVPIVPITWKTNYLVLHDPAKLFSYSLPRKIKVIVHKAVSTKGLTDADLLTLRTQIFTTIDQTLNTQHESRS